MTGESPRRKQALSVFLSTLMVLSVLAMGMAGFAGSAAASPPDDGNFDGFVASNPSGGTGSANFVVTINATDSGLVGNNLASVDENSPTVNITFPDAVDASGLDTASGSVDIEVVGPSGSLDHNLGVSNNDQIVVDQSNSRVNLTIDSQNTQINEGDLIRVVLSGDNIDYSSVDTSNSPFDVTTEVYQTGDSVGSPSQSKTLTWVLPGPIEHSDVNGNFYSLESAIDAVDSDGEYVNVTGDVSDINNEVGYEFDELEEFLTQPTAAGSTDEFDMVDKADLDNDADIVADGNVPIVWSDVGTNAAGDEVVQVGASKTVVFDGLDIRGEGFISDRANQFLDTDASGADITVKNSNFDTFDDTVLSVTNAPSGVAIENNDFDGDTADDYVGVSITDTNGNVDIGTSGAGNTFTNVSDGTGVSVTTGSNANLVNITDNTIGIDDGNGIDIDTSDQDSTVDISGNDITSDTSSGNGVIVNSANSDTDATVDISGGTIDNVTDAVDAADDATQFEGSYLNVTGVEMTNLQGASSNGITVTETNAGRLDLLVVDDVTIEGDSQTTGVNTDAQANTDVLNSVINNTNIGVNAQGSDADFNVSNTEITNSNTHAVRISDSGSNTGTFRVDQGTVIDQAGSQGIEIVDLDDNDDAVEVDNIEINGTAIGIRYNDADNTPDINITNSDITHAGTAGIQLNNNGGDGTQIRAHFNTLSDNAIGVETATDFQSSDGVSLTFNDFVGNNANGYEDSQGQSNIVVNANYNWWGDSTGPDGDGAVSNAYGDGDAVTLNNDGDATVYPFLTDSVDDLTNADQRNGDQLVTIVDPEFPVGASDADNSALVTVTNLNESAGADNPDVFASGAIVSQAESFSGTLSPSNVATFYVNSTEVGTVDVQGVADGASSDTVTQTYTGQTGDVEFASNNTGVTSDTPTEITVSGLDANNNTVERQGLSVRFAESSGFSDAGVQFKSGSRDSNTNNAGEATAIIKTDGDLTPNQEFSVSVNLDGEIVSETFTTAAGNISNADSQLRLNDGTGDATAQAGTEHDLSAQIRDSNQNALTGETVEFSSNGTVEFASQSVEVDEDGFANTTVTLGNETQGTIALNASAGDFTADNTGSARINVTTQAADATQLSVDDTSIAPDNTRTVTVSVQDEFGNLNESISNSDTSITLNTSDDTVVSVNGGEEASNDTYTSGEATFDISAEADDGSVTLTASGGSLSTDTATVSIAEVGGITLTPDSESIAQTGVSDASNSTNLTVQVTDANGDAIEANESIRLTRPSGDAAEITSASEIYSGTDGEVTNFQVNASGTDVTGDTEFRARIPGSSFDDTVTISTTGSPNALAIEAADSSVTTGTDVQVNVSVVDSSERVVPVNSGNYFEVDTTLGTLAGSDSTAALDATSGAANVTLNSSEAGTASVNVFNSAIGEEADTTVEYTEPTADFQVSNLSPAGATVTAGDNITVEADVENAGTAAGNQSVEFRLNASGEPLNEGAVQASQDVELDAGDNTTVTFENVSTDSLMAGDYDHGVFSDDSNATATITVEEAAQAEASVTFNDTTVTSGAETVTVDSADYTLADGSAGDYVVVVHVVEDDGNISDPVGYSSNVSGSAEDVTVDLNASEAQGDDLDTLTANTTLQAMLHETSVDSAFGSAIQIDGSTVTDNAEITVEESTVPTEPTDRALQIAGKDDPANLTQDDVTIAITQFERGQSANNVDIEQDDITALITLFERN